MASDDYRIEPSTTLNVPPVVPHQSVIRRQRDEIARLTALVEGG